MSAPAFAWALDQGRARKLTAPQRLVLVVLADRANGKRFCWPSFSQLMIDTGLARPTILAVVHALDRLGLIRIEKRGQGHVYHVERPAEPVQNKTSYRSKSEPATSSHMNQSRSKSEPATGSKTASDRFKNTPPTGSNSIPKPVKNLKKNLGEAEAAPAADQGDTLLPPCGASAPPAAAETNGTPPPVPTDEWFDNPTAGSALPLVRARRAAAKAIHTVAISAALPEPDEPVGPRVGVAVITSIAQRLATSAARYHDLHEPEITNPLQPQEPEHNVQVQIAAALAGSTMEQRSRASSYLRRYGA
jgi:hypothetical protein